MVKIIGVIQVKGGAGRSTVATNLAGIIGLKGARVALIDSDMPQGTSASWGSLRQAETPIDNLTIATAENHKDLVATAERLAKTHDFIVIDGPPRIAEITRATLILADLCLIPLGTSAAEIWATSDLLKTIGEAKDAAKRIDKTIDARIVWNRYRAATTAGKEMPDAVKAELGLKALNTKIGYRVAYSDALAQGLTVMEWSDRAAKEEMRELCIDIGKIIKAKLV
jgi:chromosome partitioning protein